MRAWEFIKDAHKLGLYDPNKLNESIKPVETSWGIDKNMIDNNMVVEELWQMPVKKCRVCNKPTSDCNCDGRTENE